MKTRAGFVSNSSSSSFVILGVGVTSEAYKKEIRAGIKHDYDDKRPGGCTEKFKGLDVMQARFRATGIIIVGRMLSKWLAFNKERNAFSTWGVSIDGRSALNCLLFLPKFTSAESKEIEDVLGPLGLWDENAFGFYCGTAEN